ncbi:hypothetical protein [uncultured Lactobacillus sp.]|uniref:hypothetical protein n=1 Tax=uncultured Lactobacillus sp. TaxID=153152 RepID=UPI002607CB13|nr:hypothetical protein [uncultured Lactobacillus sp.]
MHNDKNISKKVLVYLPAGIVTTPEWLFRTFTTSSLANHGIRKVTKDLRTYRPNKEAEIGNAEFVIQINNSDLVTRISADTPVVYKGFKKWEALA